LRNGKASLAGLGSLCTVSQEALDSRSQTFFLLGGYVAHTWILLFSYPLAFYCLAKVATRPNIDNKVRASVLFGSVVMWLYRDIGWLTPIGMGTLVGTGLGIALWQHPELASTKDYAKVIAYPLVLFVASFASGGGAFVLLMGLVAYYMLEGWAGALLVVAACLLVYFIYINLTLATLFVFVCFMPYVTPGAPLWLLTGVGMTLCYYSWASEYWALLFFVISHTVRGVSDGQPGCKRALTLELLFVGVHGLYGLWWLYSVGVVVGGWFVLSILAEIDWKSFIDEIAKEADRQDEEEKSKEGNMKAEETNQAGSGDDKEDVKSHSKAEAPTKAEVLTNQKKEPEQNLKRERQMHKQNKPTPRPTTVSQDAGSSASHRSAVRQVDPAMASKAAPEETIGELMEKMKLQSGEYLTIRLDPTLHVKDYQQLLAQGCKLEIHSKEPQATAGNTSQSILREAVLS